AATGHGLPLRQRQTAHNQLILNRLRGCLNLILRFCYGIFFRPSSAIFSPIALAMDSKMSFDGQKNLL
ncbi:MAG: hypothetical protein AAF998_26580, partial [Bacteroidota bacterium]